MRVLLDIYYYNPLNTLHRDKVVCPEDLVLGIAEYLRDKEEVEDTDRQTSIELDRDVISYLRR